MTVLFLNLTLPSQFCHFSAPPSKQLCSSFPFPLFPALSLSSPVIFSLKMSNLFFLPLSSHQSRLSSAHHQKILTASKLVCPSLTTALLIIKRPPHTHLSVCQYSVPYHNKQKTIITSYSITSKFLSLALKSIYDVATI